MTTQTESRSTGYDILRLIAAVGVIFGHSFPLTGVASPGFLDSGVATLSVKVFFVISGVLVTRSWLSGPSFVPFFLKRALRILPALVVLVVVSAFIIGPIFSNLAPGEYFRNSMVLGYLQNIAFYPTYSLPGVFSENRYPTAINGSLWSLPCEVVLYIFTALFLGKDVARSKVFALLLGVFFVFFGLYEVRILKNISLPVVYGTSLFSFAEVAPFYLIGALYAVFGINKKLPVWIPFLVLFGLGTFVNEPLLSEVLLLAFLPPLIVGFGEKSFAHAIMTRLGDMSYGLFLYGFVVQQCVERVWRDQLSASSNFLFSLLISAILAQLSWRFIERPALAAKSPLIKMYKSYIDALPEEVTS